MGALQPFILTVWSVRAVRAPPAFLTAAAVTVAAVLGLVAAVWAGFLARSADVLQL